MIVRTIQLENYLTGKKIYKIVTVEQHNQLLRKIAEEGKNISINIINEREL